MKIFSLLIAMLIIFSCATKSKSKQISKVETEVSNQTQSGEESGIGIKSESNYKGKGMSEFAQAVSFMNWGYSGVQGDEFSLAITETETGYQMTAKGNGTASAGKSEVDETSKWEKHYESKLDSVSNSFENKFSILNSRIEAYEKGLQIEKESTGFQAGVYIIMAFLLAIFLLLVWLGQMLKKYLKPVRSFLESIEKLMDSSV